MPRVHVASAPHTLPQLPQLLGSSFGTAVPPQIRQSSVVALQSSSMPLPQRSAPALALQPHTAGSKPSACTQPQLGAEGQSARISQRSVQTLCGPTSTQMPEAHWLWFVHAEPVVSVPRTPASPDPPPGAPTQPATTEEHMSAPTHDQIGVRIGLLLRSRPKLSKSWLRRKRAHHLSPALHRPEAPPGAVSRAKHGDEGEKWVNLGQIVKGSSR